MKYNWGIDLGGTKIECVVLEKGNQLKIVDKQRTPTESSKGYQTILGNIKRLVDDLIEKTGDRPERIGICTPGTLDPTTGTMKNSNSTALNGQPLLRDLKEVLGTDIKMSNDANCFAIAEAELGIVQEKIPEASVVFGVIMGTGVGGGIVVDGKVIDGLQGIAGEWGHNFLDESGGDCYCGRVGCVETILSGPALERYYERQSGEAKKMKEIVAAYYEGNDNYAKLTMQRLFHFFGKALGVIVNILDPDAIVIGGGVGNIGELYTIGKQEVEKYVFNHSMETPILKPKLGDSAGVYGAALLQ